LEIIGLDFPPADFDKQRHLAARQSDAIGRRDPLL